MAFRDVRVGRSSRGGGFRPKKEPKFLVTLCPRTGFFLVCFALILFTSALSAQTSVGGPQVPPVPIRVVAGADVEDLRHGRYAIREYLDVYNDDYVKVLEVSQVTANSWVGWKRDQENEDWKSEPEPLFIPPATVVRVAERQRIVGGVPRRNWWVRWLKFSIVTDRGRFESNFISSPLKSPGRVESILSQPQLDSYRAPDLPAPVPGSPDGR